MNRRGFLRFFAVATLAAATRVGVKPPAPKWTPPADSLQTYWFQTKRKSYYFGPGYLEALQKSCQQSSAVLNQP